MRQHDLLLFYQFLQVVNAGHHVPHAFGGVVVVAQLARRLVVTENQEGLTMGNSKKDEEGFNGHEP